MSVATYSTRFGLGWVEHEAGDVMGLGLPGSEMPGPAVGTSEGVAGLVIGLEAYWRGDGPLPNLPELVSKAATTPLLGRIYRVVSQIPAGSTATYTEVAVKSRVPAAARAVGSAMARNPFAPLIPCHRVVGADGSLRGYGGGLEMKRYLLDMERKSG